MKILHLIDYFQPQVGYQETFLALEHQKAGHDVTVVTSDRYYPFANYNSTYLKLLGKRKKGSGDSIESGIRTVRLPALEIPGSPLVYLFGLKKTIMKIKPDLVLCHGMHSITSKRAARIKKQSGFKLIFDTHAAAFNTKYDSLPKQAYRALFKILAVKTIKNAADAVFAIGEEERNLICQDFELEPERIPIIRLGVDTDRFKFSLKERNSVRSKLRISKKDIVIVFAGKILPGKDLHVLFEALNKINDEKIRLLMIGSGSDEYLERLKNIIPGKRAVWIDYVENKDLSKYFSSADIAVWPGDPAITMLEAFSCSLPLILCKRYGTRYLDKSKAVLRFERGNSNKLMESIKKLAYNEKIRKIFRLNARKYSSKYLSWIFIARESLKIIQKQKA